MMEISPVDLLSGKVVIVAPHMDDEALACGGSIALLPQKENVHVIYATDGMRSPSPILPQDEISPDLGEIRRKESMAAMGVLGVPAANLEFACLPEAELAKHVGQLRDTLLQRIEAIKPDQILMPFRFDRHPDHLAINHVLTSAHKQGRIHAQLIEYFVYYNWRLLPGRDVRQYIRQPHLLSVDTQTVAVQKRKALDCFQSQTTIFYPWQTRPILTPQLLDEVSQSSEFFLRYDPYVSGAAVFAKAVVWIRFVHRVEPWLQKSKYLLGASLQRRLRRG